MANYLAELNDVMDDMMVANESYSDDYFDTLMDVLEEPTLEGLFTNLNIRERCGQSFGKFASKVIDPSLQVIHPYFSVGLLRYMETVDGLCKVKTEDLFDDAAKELHNIVNTKAANIRTAQIIALSRKMQQYTVSVDRLHVDATSSVKTKKIRVSSLVSSSSELLAVFALVKGESIDIKTETKYVEQLQKKSSEINKVAIHAVGLLDEKRAEFIIDFIKTLSLFTHAIGTIRATRNHVWKFSELLINLLCNDKR